MKKNKKLIMVISFIVLVLIILYIFMNKEDDNLVYDVVMIEVSDNTGNIYQNGITVLANDTIDIEVKVKNNSENEIYNYGLYYKIVEGEDHGIVIGEVINGDSLITEGSISSSLIVPIRITNVSNESKTVDIGVLYSKVAIEYGKGENKIGEYDANIANEPNLASGMIPITYNEFKKVWEKADYSNWYDYENKKWANAVMVTDNTRSNYINADVGTEVLESDILAYLVWIPRYRYKLFNANFQNVSAQEIEIEFETKNNIKSNGTNNGEWLTHPAFTFGDTELSGIWVGKFETTGTSNNPTVKPNLVALTNQNVSSQFETSQKFNYVLESEVSKIDSHVAKNIEWGAIVYLSHSKYGTCVDGVCKSVRNNNVNTLTNQNGPSITGCASLIADGDMVVSDTCTTDVSRAYNDNEYGVLASTTHSVYGVYDMSGGSWEIVMGVMSSEDGTNIITGRKDTKNSGYTGLLFDSEKNITKLFNGKDLPDSKYYDLYSYNSDMFIVDKSHLGDATGETFFWYYDFANFVFNTESWFMRGGLYNHNYSDGIFAYGGVDGRSSILRSFRLVITNK